MQRVVSIFGTGEAGSGAPVAFVEEAKRLSRKEMQALAQALGCAETGFVVGREGDRVQMRIFAPEGELGLGVDAPLAAAAHLGPVLFEMPNGRVLVERDGARWRARIDAPLVPLTAVQPAFAARALSLSPLALDSHRMPAGVAVGGTPLLVVGVQDAEALATARFEKWRLDDLVHRQRYDGIVAFSVQGSRGTVRAFLEPLGVREETLAGLGLAALVAWLADASPAAEPFSLAVDSSNASPRPATASIGRDERGPWIRGRVRPDR